MTIHSIRGQAIPLESSAFTSAVSLREPQDHVQELVQRSRDAWTVLVNHPFPRDMANGQASLNGFRHYMIVSTSPSDTHRLVLSQSTARCCVPGISRSSENGIHRRFAVQSVFPGPRGLCSQTLTQPSVFHRCERRVRETARHSKEHN
jgi:hypothetical protein